MAHKKAGGSTGLGRDSQAKRLGIKVFGGQLVKEGGIIVRQRGTRFSPGSNAMIGTDDTVFATSSGIVQFKKKKENGFTGKLKEKTVVSVIPTKTK